jgi:hypothetical protein
MQEDEGFEREEFRVAEASARRENSILLKVRCALRRTAPHCTVWHRTAPHRTAPHRMAPHCTALHSTTPNHTAWRRTEPRAF